MTISRTEPRGWTKGPWQFAYGDLYDHGEDGDANGFTVLMAGARTRERPENETPGAGADRIGKALGIHEVRIAEEIFPEDVERDEAEANARLIAGAPELYEALSTILDAIGGWESTDIWCSDARSALASVEGENEMRSSPCPLTAPTAHAASRKSKCAP